MYQSVITCDRCPRIVDFRTKVAREKRKQFRDWTYWGKPIPGYGDPKGELLLVGLAPAAHGGNRTARVFTGDKSADFLVNSLHAEGLSNQPNSDALDDGLELNNTFMTPVLKCVPPQDKPTAAELQNCAPFFRKEMELLTQVKVILALGKIGFDGCLKYFRHDFDLKMKDYPFGHDKRYVLPNGMILWGCYHPSPRNVNTGRMNFEMMTQLLRKIKKTLK
ncbi:MAG: uracil-DNA glycosylase [Candidatus Marinimicrobia bacterium]|nr:uracil-DNA glycosylase [Candidatus Neomarinimicrobiota bacterium]